MDNELAEAHRRIVEEAISDERVLGALPEDASRTLLDWEISRLDAAASASADAVSFLEQADAIRTAARAIASAAAADGDDGVALAQRLGNVMITGAHDVGSATTTTDAAHEWDDPVQRGDPNPMPSDVGPQPDEASADASGLGEAVREAFEDAVGRIRRLFGGEGNGG